MKILKYVKTKKWDGIVFEDNNNKLKITSGIYIWNFTKSREIQTIEVNKNDIDLIKIMNKFNENFPYLKLAEQ